MVLLIDNYDSFTYNLVHRIAELGATVRVVRNDAMTVEAIEQLRPDHLVISPGPGRPEGAGVTVELLRRLAGRLPILGVCLGHQALAVAFGGAVTRAPVPMHGKVSAVEHTGTGLFVGLDQPIEAGRYHSLIVAADGVPPGFVVDARVAGEPTIMGMRHAELPVFGVQFHPESVLTPTGQAMLGNFLEMK